MKNRMAVIGAGPGGYAAAVRAAQLGAKVTLVEAEQVGGTCLNRGCIPSKVMKATSDLLDSMHRAAEFGIRLKDSPIADMPRLLIRKKAVIDTQAAGMMRLLQQNKIQYVAGRASITGYGRIEVRSPDGSRSLVDWDRLIIATGTRPRPLITAPFDGKKILSSDHILNIDAMPESVIIVGGGVIGCEFACILSALGAAVTIVEELPRILGIPSVDADSAKLIQRELKKRNITLWLGRRADVTALQNDRIHVRLTVSPFADPKDGDAGGQLAAEMVLVSIGRVPDTDHLGLDTIGVQTDAKGWIIADSRMATPIEGVYAIGDILGPEKIMLAHVASAEGVCAAENALGNRKIMRYDAVPTAIYTTPEVGSVGLTETQAIEAGKSIRIDRFLFRQLGKAHVIGHIAGEVKMISEKNTGVVLGVHIVGPHATDLIAEAVLAVTTGRSVVDIAEAIHAHPTLSEAVMETAQIAARAHLALFPLPSH